MEERKGADRERSGDQQAHGAWIIGWGTSSSWIRVRWLRSNGCHLVILLPPSKLELMGLGVLSSNKFVINHNINQLIGVFLASADNVTLLLISCSNFCQIIIVYGYKQYIEEAQD